MDKGLDGALFALKPLKQIIAGDKIGALLIEKILPFFRLFDIVDEKKIGQALIIEVFYSAGADESCSTGHNDQLVILRFCVHKTLKIDRFRGITNRNITERGRFRLARVS